MDEEAPGDSPHNSQRVFKKSSPNNKLTLYLVSRDLVVETHGVDRIQGVLHVDADYVENRKLYGQVTLTFRYGREDEEVMGLKFCNEAIMSLAQVWPINCNNEKEPSTSLQEALVKRLGSHAYPFQLELTPLAPPSVQLVPAKQYHGAPIGTSYDVRAFIAEKVDEKVSRRNTVRMGIRVLQGATRATAGVPPPPSPSHSSFSIRSHYHLFRLRRNRKQPEEPEAPLGHAAPPGPGVPVGPEALPGPAGPLEPAAPPGPGIPVGPEALPGPAGPIGSEVPPGPGVPVGPVALPGPAGPLGPEAPPGPGVPVGPVALPGPAVPSGSEAPPEQEAPAEAETENACAERPAPRVKAEKGFLLCEGKLELECWLDKSAYHHGEPVTLNFTIINCSNKTVQHIKAIVVQHVDVCMFSNGKFKNVVAAAEDDGTPVPPGRRLDDAYSMTPSRGVTKNWIALEDSYSKTGGCLASTVLCNSNSPEDRNVFAIYVSYYVKVTLCLSGFGGELSVKLPFSLSHASINEAPTDSVMEEPGIPEGRENSEGEDKGKDDDATDDQTDLDEPDAPSPTRQCVSADVCVNIIENKLCERPRFEGPPAPRARPDEAELDLIVRYPGPDT